MKSLSMMMDSTSSFMQEETPGLDIIPAELHLLTSLRRRLHQQFVMKKGPVQMVNTAS